MEDKQYRRMRKQMKNHGRVCPKCGNPKRDGCYSDNCLVQHCACRMTDPDIKD